MTAFSVRRSARPPRLSWVVRFVWPPRLSWIILLPRVPRHGVVAVIMNGKVLAAFAFSVAFASLGCSGPSEFSGFDSPGSDRLDDAGQRRRGHVPRTSSPPS